MSKYTMNLINEEDALLTTVAKEFTGKVEDWKDTFDQMYELMLSNRGIGLAANQVGIDARFFIMKMNNECKVFINPRIIEMSDEQPVTDEGCLSFKGLFLKIKRPTWVMAEYTNKEGQLVSEKLEGTYAQCYVHELEHLNGIVFTTKVAKLSLTKAKEKRNKLIRKAGKQS